MPITGTGANKAGTGATGSGRAVIRPPWLKDGPKPIPMPTEEAPWVKRNSVVDKLNGAPQKEAKLQSREIKVPVLTERKKSIPEPVATVKAKAKAAEPAPSVKPKETAAAVKPKGKVAPKPPVESSSSSEYEEVTDEEGSEEEDEVSETESESESEIEVKPLPIQVKLRPVEKKAPIKLDKSASSDKAGKFVRPVLKKVAKIDEEPKAAPPPPVLEKKVLKPVAKPETKEPPKVEQKDFRPPLKKVDSTVKRREYFCLYWFELRLFFYFLRTKHSHCWLEK